MVFGRVQYILILNVFVNDCICVMISCGVFEKNLCKSVVSCSKREVSRQEKKTCLSVNSSFACTQSLFSGSTIVSPILDLEVMGSCTVTCNVYSFKLWNQLFCSVRFEVQINLFVDQFVSPKMNYTVLYACYTLLATVLVFPHVFCSALHTEGLNTFLH